MIFRCIFPNSVTWLNCKLNSSDSKIPWPKLSNEVLNQYNSTPHSVTKFSPSYLLLGHLTYDPLLPNNNSSKYGLGSLRKTPIEGTPPIGLGP